MTGTADRVEVLANALDQAHTVLDGITPDQRDAPTPCASWDVSAVVRHLFVDVEQFVAMARGEQFDPAAAPPDIAPENWAVAFAERSAELMSAWRRAESQATIDMQIAELALHAWDLDVATDQHVVLDPLLAEIGLAWMRGMLKDEYRGSEADGKSFGPEVTVSEDASAYERLAAFSGRTPV